MFSFYAATVVDSYAACSGNAKLSLYLHHHYSPWDMSDLFVKMSGVSSCVPTEKFVSDFG